MGSVSFFSFFFWRSSFRDCTALITSLFCTRKMADACLVCLYQQETSSRGIPFTKSTCVPFFCELRLWYNICFYGVNSSGKETGDDRQTAMRLDATPESLPESLNMSRFFWPEKCEICLSLRLCECKYCIPNLSNVNLCAPNPNNIVRNSFGISNKVCYLPSTFLEKPLTRMNG